MTETAPLVVMGGGIMGSCITYFLAAAGLGTAELILEGRSRSVDLEPYRLSRFGDGKPILSRHEYTFGPPPEE